jgi:hypothetical protein
MLLAITIPGAIVFFRQAKSTKEKRVKIRSNGIAFAFIWITVPALYDFFIDPLPNTNPAISDITFTVFFIILLVTVALAYPPVKKRRVKVKTPRYFKKSTYEE